MHSVFVPRLWYRSDALIFEKTTYMYVKVATIVLAPEIRLAVLGMGNSIVELGVDNGDTAWRGG